MGSMRGGARDPRTMHEQMSRMQQHMADMQKHMADMMGSTPSASPTPSPDKK
jgi:DNA-binding protein YbaB